MVCDEFVFVSIYQSEMNMEVMLRHDKSQMFFVPCDMWEGVTKHDLKQNDFLQ